MILSTFIYFIFFYYYDAWNLNTFNKIVVKYRTDVTPNNIQIGSI